MQLLTKEIQSRLPKLYATENIPLSEKVVQVKFFDPTGSWTWYAVEGSPQQRLDGKDDFVFFGLVDGFEKEWGYFALSELESVRGRLGIGLERDLCFQPKTIGELGLE